MGETKADRGAESAPEAPLRCDFCGAEVPRVRRVALDGDYDRLQQPHAVRYACPECSQRKERERLGLERR
jgi:ribosomal protein L37AE/L43A